MTLLDDDAVDAYLERIKAKRPELPTADALRELHRQHIFHVPYETVHLHQGERLLFGMDAYHKIVRRGRGGTCFELNSPFAELLRALGFQVDVLASRVFYEGKLGPLQGHMVLRVVTADSPEPWLADVGYGPGFLHPVRFDSRVEQSDPHGVYRFVDGEYGDIDLVRDGEPQYRVDTRPRTYDDFHAMGYYYEHAPDSPPILYLYATRATPTGRITIMGDKLTIRSNGEKTKRHLASEAELIDEWRTWFGIELTWFPPLPPPVGR
jgi:N-hydroxyarylamine O-acetyltransferase